MTIKSTCPKCNAELPYVPDDIAPYCEMCGTKIHHGLLQKKSHINDNTLPSR